MTRCGRERAITVLAVVASLISTQASSELWAPSKIWHMKLRPDQAVVALRPVASFFKLRGGANKIVGEDENEDEEPEVQTEDENTITESVDATNGDFEGEDTLVRRLKSAIERTPPITQAFLSMSIAVTVGSMLLNKNQWPEILLLDWEKFSKGQIWRVFTTFLYFGPCDISYVLTVQFVWQYICVSLKKFIIMSLNK
jgi:hypothetical protein